MAEVVKLVQGSKELDLDDGTNYETKRVFLETPQDKELWHTPDYGESAPVRAQPSDRPCTLDLRIKGTADAVSGDTAEDGVQNNIVTLRRWFNEAKRAELDGDVDPVYLTLQKDNATNEVRHRIKAAYIDDSLSHYIAERHQGLVQALHVTVNSVLAPSGEYTSTISLKNDMFSSPHFVEDSNSDGLADGWDEISAGETTLFHTGSWMLGGQSQQVTTDNAGSDGIKSDVVTIAQGNDIVAYAWVHHSSGDSVTVRLTDGAGGIIEDKIVNAGNADKSSLGGAGTSTWYRIPVGGNNAAAANAILQVVRLAGVATQNTVFLVDACYLEVDQTVTPDAWMSARNIDNRGDVGDNAGAPTQAQENQLNYVDTWDIPGDAPALAKWHFDVGAPTNGTATIAAMRTDQLVPAAQIPHWVDSSDFTIDGGTDWTRVTPDGARTGNGYIQVDLSAAVDKVVWASIDNVEHLMYAPLRVFVIMNVANVLDGLVVRIYQSDESLVFNSSGYYAGDTGAWRLVDFGILDATGLKVAAETTGADWKIGVSGLNTNAVVKMDAVLLLPTRQFPVTDSVANGRDRYIDGFDKRYSIDPSTVNSYLEKALLGEFWELYPGISNRCIYVLRGTSTNFEAYDHTYGMATTVEIRPRTRHLLGT